MEAIWEINILHLVIPGWYRFTDVPRYSQTAPHLTSKLLDGLTQEAVEQESAIIVLYNRPNETQIIK